MLVCLSVCVCVCVCVCKREREGERERLVGLLKSNFELFPLSETVTKIQSLKKHRLLIKAFSFIIIHVKQLYHWIQIIFSNFTCNFSISKYSLLFYWISRTLKFWFPLSTQAKICSSAQLLARAEEQSRSGTRTRTTLLTARYSFYTWVLWENVSKEPFPRTHVCAVKFEPAYPKFTSGSVYQ